MASAIKKTTFDDLYNTFHSVCQKIDEAFAKAKENKGKKIYEGHDNYKDFLRHVELQAIKDTAKEQKLTPDAVRERWKVLTLPFPVYDALERDLISFSKAKLFMHLTLDPDSEKDQATAQNLINAVEKNISVDTIKEMVKKESETIWNETTVVMNMYAGQHGVNAKTVC